MFAMVMDLIEVMLTSPPELANCVSDQDYPSVLPPARSAIDWYSSGSDV